MNPGLKAELIRLVNRASGCFDSRFFHAVDKATDNPSNRTHPDEVAELLGDIQPGAGEVYREWRGL